MTQDNKQFGGHLARLLYGGFLKLWKVIGPGWEIVEKKDAVGILIYHRDKQQLLLVKQYRPASGRRMIETIAGHIERLPLTLSEAEWARLTMAREVQEESGAKIDPDQIELLYDHPIFTSPGFTTEKLWLGYAEIGDSDIEQAERTFGLAEEGEQIERIWIGVNYRFPDYIARAIECMKTLVLLQWFLRNKYPQLAQNNKQGEE